MSASAAAIAAAVSAALAGGAYYYFEVFKKPTTTDPSGANTKVLASATSTPAAATPAAATPAAATPAAATGTSTTPTAVTYTTFPGVDQNGGDIWSGTATSLTDCNSKCTANTGCVATQYKTTGNACWLKGTITPGAFGTVDPSLGGTLSFSNAKAVSGSNAVNVDHPNADVTGGYTVGDEAHCQQLGMLSPGVVASVYAPNEKWCWLKSGLTGATNTGDRNTYTFNK